MARFSGEGYIHYDLSALNPPPSTTADQIKFRFKTSNQNGVLLYADGNQGDFIALQLHRGNLLFSIDLGIFFNFHGLFFLFCNILLRCQYSFHLNEFCTRALIGVLFPHWYRLCCCALTFSHTIVKGSTQLKRGLTQQTGGSLLDDSQWHDVIIKRNHTKMTLIVDRLETHFETNGLFFRLNLDKKVRCGCHGDLSFCMLELWNLQILFITHVMCWF